MRVRVLFCLLCFSLLALSCEEAGKSEDTNGSSIKRVIFIPKITGNAFFEVANSGAQEMGEKYGFKVTYAGSPKADVQAQAEIIKQAVEEKADAICISSLSPTLLDLFLKEALDSGIKVVTWDSDVSGDARMLMVAQGTPEQLGRMLVEMGAKSLAERGINPNRAPVGYVWHYSDPSVADQNSWRVAGEDYIRSTYPHWRNLAPQNFYSRQDLEEAVRVGTQILIEYPQVDLIICNDSTSLPGQAQAAKDLGLSADTVTITGFASPAQMRDFCKENILTRWGLWDCRTQGALGCYLAYYLASGHSLKVGDRVDVPGIGTVEIMPNTVLYSKGYAAEYSGVVLLPERMEFTINSVDLYDF